MASAEASDVKTWLEELDFPAGKDRILDHVRQQGAPADVEAALRTLPVAEYGNAGEAAHAVPHPDKRSEDTSSKQSSSHTHSGLAEDERAVSDNPIVQERGDNRGS